MRKIVSIQGVKGAFHQEAAQQYFGDDIDVCECLTFSRLIESVETREADFGVMAIENSLVGSILQNYTLLRESSVGVIGEVYLRIEQNLMALPGETLETIREARSHPMALAQCEGFFRNHSHIRLIETEDTALSARQIAAESLSGVATVASVEAARQYGLSIVARSIESNKENYTRFLVLSGSNNPKIPTNATKASITFTTIHQPGSLLMVLQPLARHGINLTMLQSLPQVGKRWEYIFHADLVFGQQSVLALALEEIRRVTSSLKILGIYRASEPLMRQLTENESVLASH